MPLFRFLCKDCKTESELLLEHYDSPAVCPKCGSHKMTKQPSHISAVLSAGPRSCARRHDCPEAGHHCCGANCGCGHHS